MSRSSSPTLVWAHRGASGEAPENTIEAFRLAIAQEADGIELDVQLSRDKVPVVIHDETLDRTTDGAGAVVDSHWEYLRGLRASAGIEGYHSARIPGLAEVLDLIAPTPLLINIELKNSEVGYPGLEEKVLAEVEDRGLAARVVYSSFNHDSVARLSTMTDSELAILYERPLLRPVARARKVGANALHPPRQLVLNARWVATVRRLGLAVRPWVVNGEARVRTALDQRVDGLITDFPAAAVGWRKAVSDEERLRVFPAVKGPRPER